MPFLGDDLAISSQFQGLVLNEITTSLTGYAPFTVSPDVYPQLLTVSPDYPPDAAYLGDARYSLTGEYYVDTDDLQHFQIWLWNSSGSLIYTDEMVFEDMDEAATYLPPMISWVFSHIPVAVTIAETIVRTENSDSESGSGSGSLLGLDGSPLFVNELRVGLRGGFSYNIYNAYMSAGGYEAGQSQGFSGQGAVLLEYRIFPFLALQGEAAFAYDTFVAAKIITQQSAYLRSTDRFRTISLMFPLLLKIPIRIGSFILAPFGGIYYALPLGDMQITDSEKKSYSQYYAISPPLGLIWGADVALRLGPGDLFADLRFNKDIGMSVVKGGQGLQYSRSRFALSVGYKLFVLGRVKKSSSPQPAQSDPPQATPAEAEESLELE
ncbi:MAG: hypothetical protein LBL19_02395 [Spirochaetaceae bacterium]|nr:hypothetical protein [Spirochaetaceae bacterium]